MFRAHPLRLVLGTVSAAAIIVLVASAPAAAKVTGHLYTGAGQFEVLRFPLVDGIPTQHPDLKIPNTGDLIAVQPDGTLVAQINGLSKVGFFALGHTKPDRVLNIRPSKQGCAIRPASIAVDSQGDLYVARSIPDPCYLDDIAVYAPNASGNDNPIATVKATAGQIAVDPKNGEIFDSVIVLNSQATIYAFGSLAQRLHPLRKFSPGAEFPQQMTINADSDFHTLWIYTTPAGYGANSIVEYYTTSAGLTFPIQGLFPDNNADVAFTGAVAYRQGYYYSTFGGARGQGIYTYHTHRAPDATLNFSVCCIDHIAVGP
jgi:hypothetical protein